MKLDSLSIDELVRHFVLLSEQQYPFTLNDEGPKATGLIMRRSKINQELQRRGVAARMELTRLFTHPNIQVRLNAAKSSLGVTREAALHVLRQVAREDLGPFRLDARMTIALVEDGTVIPQ